MGVFVYAVIGTATTLPGTKSSQILREVRMGSESGGGSEIRS